MSRPPVTKDGRHHFKWMTYEGQKVRIDKDVVPMLTLLWKMGIKTSNSCHGHCSFNCKHKSKITKMKDGGLLYGHTITKHCYDNVWLVFDEALDVEDFFNAVAEYVHIEDEEGTMYAHIQGHSAKRYPHENWVLRFYPRNYGEVGHWGRPIFNGKRSTQQMWIETGCEENNFIMQPQLTFPRKHLPYIEERLKLALKNRKKK